MARRQERRDQGRREALERALERLEAGNREEFTPVLAEDLFFHDHADLVRGLG
jgi:hypothetical protein